MSEVFSQSTTKQLNRRGASSANLTHLTHTHWTENRLGNHWEVSVTSEKYLIYTHTIQGRSYYFSTRVLYVERVFGTLTSTLCQYTLGRDSVLLSNFCSLLLQSNDLGPCTRRSQNPVFLFLSLTHFISTLSTKRVSGPSSTTLTLTHTHIHTFVRTPVHTWVYVHTSHTYTYTRINVHTHTRTHTDTHTYTYVGTHSHLTYPCLHGYTQKQCRSSKAEGRNFSRYSSKGFRGGTGQGVKPRDRQGAPRDDRTPFPQGIGGARDGTADGSEDPSTPTG